MGINDVERPKDRIRTFTTEYSQRQALNTSTKVKAINDSLAKVEAGRGFPKDRSS